MNWFNWVSTLLSCWNDTPSCIYGTPSQMLGSASSWTPSLCLQDGWLHRTCYSCRCHVSNWFELLFCSDHLYPGLGLLHFAILMDSTIYLTSSDEGTFSQDSVTPGLQHSWWEPMPSLGLSSLLSVLSTTAGICSLHPEVAQCLCSIHPCFKAKQLLIVLLLLLHFITWAVLLWFQTVILLKASRICCFIYFAMAPAQHSTACFLSSRKPQFQSSTDTWGPDSWADLLYLSH